MSPSPDISITVAYDDDVAAAAEALLALLRRPEPDAQDEPEAAPAENAA